MYFKNDPFSNFVCVQLANSSFLIPTVVDDLTAEGTAKTGRPEGEADVTAPAMAAAPPSVVISSEPLEQKPSVKPATQSSTHVSPKQPSRGGSGASTHRAASPARKEAVAPEPVVPPPEKPAECMRVTSIFLQTAAFLLEVNALQVRVTRIS